MAPRALKRNRDLLIITVPAVLLVVLAFGLTLFFMRPAPPRQIYRWYGRLKKMELELEEPPDREQLEAMLRRLDQMDEAVSQLDPPLAFSENLYIFRQHIDLVRERALARMRRADQSAGPPKQAAQQSDAGEPLSR